MRPTWTDRKELSQLYGLTPLKETESSSSSARASASRPRGNPINTPSNPPRPLDPWRHVQYDNLHKKKSGKTEQPRTGRSILDGKAAKSPQVKRLRVDQTFQDTNAVSSSRGARTPATHSITSDAGPSSRQPRSRKQPSNFMQVSDDEDVGTVINTGADRSFNIDDNLSSADPLDCLTTSEAGISGLASHEITMIDGGEEEQDLVKGISKDKIVPTSKGHESSSDIEEFEPTPSDSAVRAAEDSLSGKRRVSPGFKSIQSGTVSKQKSKLDGLRQLDLQHLLKTKAVPTGTSVAKKMKNSKGEPTNAGRARASFKKPSVDNKDVLSASSGLYRPGGQRDRRRISLPVTFWTDESETCTATESSKWWFVWNDGEQDSSRIGFMQEGPSETEVSSEHCRWEEGQLLGMMSYNERGKAPMMQLIISRHNRSKKSNKDSLANQYHLTFEVSDKTGPRKQDFTRLREILESFLPVGEVSTLDTHAAAAILETLKASPSPTIKRPKEFAKRSVTPLDSSASATTRESSVHSRLSAGKDPPSSETLDYVPTSRTSSHLVSAPYRPPQTVPRRSARRSVPTGTNEQQAAEPPPQDLDEIILVHPSTGPGGLPLTRMDVKRLMPGEFLNDTLIEFFLKLWHKELYETSPALAEQTYIFNSFFYKKLNLRNFRDGYDSVRKWTSKIDLFEKKYIIVPINEHVHWYLALIYHPQHILEPSPEGPAEVVMTRSRQKRLSDPSGIAPVSAARSGPTDGAVVPAELEEPQGADEADASVSSSNSTVPASENDVVEMLQLNHCSISDVGSNPRDNPRDLGATVVESPDMDMIPAEPPLVKPASDVESADNADDAMAMDDDDNMSDLYVGVPDGASAETKRAPQPKGVATGIDPGTFYGTTASHSDSKKRKRDADDHDDVVEMQEPDIKRISTPEPALSADIIDIASESTPRRRAAQGPPRDRTLVFTMDSLGSKHPQVGRVLGEYLAMEAKEKKNVLNPGEVQYRKATVPKQPNYCDCGIYLLHFVETFMSDPDKYCRLAWDDRLPKGEHSDEWDAKAADSRRHELSAKIEAMSEDWKKNKPEPKPKDDSVPHEESDDEIEVGPITRTRGRWKGIVKDQNVPTESKQKAATRLR